MAAVCKDGYCVCNNQDYDYNTCLPDAYGCKIEVNADTALAKPRYNSGHAIYSCTPGNSSTQYEVHVLAMHETPGRTGHATVNIISHGKSNRSIVLVLGSYQPVNWILSLPSNVSISKVVLIAFYLAESSVSGDVNQVETIERKSSCDSELWKWGFGSDTGGGDTVGLLKQLVCNRFGVVTSFTGTYRAYEWSLVVHSSKGSAKARSPQCHSLAQPTQSSPSVSRARCPQCQQFTCAIDSNKPHFIRM